MTNAGDPSALSACGCCEGEPGLAEISNRPRQGAISYRLGTYEVFVKRLLDQISSASIPDGPNRGVRPLTALTTRAPNDPAIALLDAWAMVADILTFYQERIANEGYLRTAAERRSVLELARAIGYELSPGVAASVYLQFAVEQIAAAAATAAAAGSGVQPPAGPGSSPFNAGIVRIPLGTQVQSVPSPGNLPQPFETSADFSARVEWNSLTPRLRRSADLALSNGKLYLLASIASFPPGTFVPLDPADVYLINPAVHLPLQFPDPSWLSFRRRRFSWTESAGIPAIEVSQIYFQGTATNLKKGDRILLVGTNNGLFETQTFVVRNVEAQSSFNRTRVDFGDNPSPPPFAVAALPQEVPQVGQIPFTQENVDLHIRERTISEPDIQAFLKINRWDPRDLVQLVNNPPASSGSAAGAFAFRATASFFGNNAPKWSSLPDPSKSQRADPYPLDWDAANSGAGRYIWSDSQGNPYQAADVYLERPFPQVVANSWTLLEASGVGAAVFQIAKTSDASLADYGVSGKATGLALRLPGPKSTGLGAPAAVSRAVNSLDAFAIGLDGTLYHRWWNGAWGGPENLGGTGLAGAPSAASWAGNRLDVFAITRVGNLVHWWWAGANWGGPENLGGGNLVGSPSAVSWAANRLDIFALSAGGALVHWWWDGGWGGPESLGGTNLVGSPSAVSWAANRLDVFANGSDGNLRHKWWDGSSWGGGPSLENLGGGNLVNSPSAVSWAANRLDVFANGSDGNLRHTWWDGSNWGGGPSLENLGGGDWVNSPSAVSWAANRLDVFGIGSNGSLRHKWWDGSNWGGPEDRGGGGNMIASPAAVSWSANRLDIFTSGSLGHWLHTWWQPGWGGPEDLGNGNLLPFPVRGTTAYIQTEPLALADLPVVDDIAAGSLELMLDDMVLGLQAGQPVVLTGMRADAQAVIANEMLLLQSISHVGGCTSIRFAAGLQHSYRRETVTISANVVLATHGASVQEVLGSGDASGPNQTFSLKRPPLTYVSAPTPSGIASSLEIQVNDLAWKEAPTLYGLSSSDQQYVVRLADEGTPKVTFGDPAARLPTGQQNVRAKYRTGVGLLGNVAAGAISMLQSRPPGLRGVTNPLPASGGADPQDIAHARENAPLTVLTLDRIVSLADYDNFARGFGGIGKAQAIAVWSGETRLVHLTVAAADGTAVDAASPLYATLVQAIDLARDPVQQVIVASHQPLTFNLAAGILVDRSRYQFDRVVAEVIAALTTNFAFVNRAFAQAVTAAEIVTLVQSVPGVIAVDLTQLYLTSDPDGPNQTEPPPFLPASPARWEGGAIAPAQLILLNPLGVNITEMTS
jgi:Baseplate J-like protein/Repeat of unknown function (DUF346)